MTIKPVYHLPNTTVQQLSRATGMAPVDVVKELRRFGVQVLHRIHPAAQAIRAAGNACSCGPVCRRPICRDSIEILLAQARAMDAEHISGDSPCIPNPYRKEAENNE